MRKLYQSLKTDIGYVSFYVATMFYAMLVLMFWLAFWGMLSGVLENILFLILLPAFCLAAISLFTFNMMKELNVTASVIVIILITLIISGGTYFLATTFLGRIENVNPRTVDMFSNFMTAVSALMYLVLCFSQKDSILDKIRNKYHKKIEEIKLLAAEEIAKMEAAANIQIAKTAIQSKIDTVHHQAQTVKYAQEAEKNQQQNPKTIILEPKQ